MRIIKISIENIRSENISTLLHDAANVFAEVINSAGTDYDMIKYLQDGLEVSRPMENGSLRIYIIE